MLNKLAKSLTNLGSQLNDAESVLLSAQGLLGLDKQAAEQVKEQHIDELQGLAKPTSDELAIFKIVMTILQEQSDWKSF